MKLSERLGRWRARGGCVVASRPFACQRRLGDDCCLDYGGPYMVGESMTPSSAEFLEGLPSLVAVLERVAAEDCSCVAMPCAHQRIRTALAHFERPLNTSSQEPMTLKSTDGGPAFPVPMHQDPTGDYTVVEEPRNRGMTLRDYFAGQVIGHMAHCVMFPQKVEDQLHRQGVKTEEFEAYTAWVAYNFADAMIAERARREAGPLLSSTSGGVRRLAEVEAENERLRNLIRNASPIKEAFRAGYEAGYADCDNDVDWALGLRWDDYSAANADGALAFGAPEGTKPREASPASVESAYLKTIQYNEAKLAKAFGLPSGMALDGTVDEVLFKLRNCCLLHGAVKDKEACDVCNGRGAWAGLTDTTPASDGGAS